MKSTGIGDTAHFGPEPEFFIFDAVTWNVDMSGCSVKIKSEEAPWSAGEDFEGGNMGHRPPIKGGYFPVPPVDSLQDIRSAICLALEEMGVEVEVHHHEVAAAGQNEIGTKFNSLVKRADWMQILKYCVHNVAHSCTARRRRSCRNRLSAITVQACTFTSRCGKAARIFSAATATRVFRSLRSTTLAVSSSMPKR